MPALELNDSQLLRYSRHVLLSEVGIEGQTRIAHSTVLVVGAGGLGCPAAQYLAAAGVGHLVLADADTVDLTNLQRQVLHTTERVGMLKVESAAVQIAALNPEVKLTLLRERLDASALNTWLPQVDLVLDCCDNFATRHAVNRACVQHQKPLVSGAAIRQDGQLACFGLHEANSPCYHCVFPDGEDVVEERCATMGVFAPLTGIVGTLQAAEALKILGGFGKPLYNTLLMIDSLGCDFTRLKFKKDPGCAVCGQAHAPVAQTG